MRGLFSERGHDLTEWVEEEQLKQSRGGGSEEGEGHGRSGSWAGGRMGRSWGSEGVVEMENSRSKGWVQVEAG